MKKIINLILIIAVSPLLAMAEINETVIKTLKDTTRNHIFEVDKQSYAFNVNGYACQWPGLRIADWMIQADLNHYRKFGSDEFYLAVGIKNPDHQYCSGFADAQTVFGPRFKEGAKASMTINNRLDHIERETINGSSIIKQKLIRETITISVFGRDLETVHEIEVPNL